VKKMENQKLYDHLYKLKVECRIESGFNRKTFQGIFNDNFYKYFDFRVGEVYEPAILVTTYDKNEETGILTYGINFVIVTHDPLDRTPKNSALLAMSDYLHKELDENLVSVSDAELIGTTPEKN
jgi:hypothetical protein